MEIKENNGKKEQANNSREKQDLKEEFKPTGFLQSGKKKNRNFRFIIFHYYWCNGRRNFKSHSI